MNNNDNDLSISIRARILPIIEGSDALRQQIDQLPTSISNRMQETVSDPNFQKGLSDTQRKKVEHLVNFSDSYEFEQIQAREKSLIDDYALALESGKLTKAQTTSYRKKFKQLGNDYTAFGTEFIPSQLDEEYYSDIDPNKKEMLRASAKHGAGQAKWKISGITRKLEEINYANDYLRMSGQLEKEQLQRQKNLEFDLEEGGGFGRVKGQRYLKEERNAIQKREEMAQAFQEKFSGTVFGDRVFKTMSDDIESAKMRMQAFSDEIEKASKGSGNLLENLKAAGLLTMAGVAVNAGMNYWLQGKRIEAAERTSFDFGSPMGMYSAEQEFELYKRNTERTQQAELTGGIGGSLLAGAGALALGATGIGIPAAIVGGYFAGSSLLSKFAEGENVTDTAEVQERLKRRGQVFEQLNSMVEGSSGFDILRARTRARIGNDASVLSPVDDNLGYTPEKRLQMRTQFADTLGKYDESLYGEQTTFARAKGIDPDAIYQLNLSARMTGMDVGIGGLDKAKQLATATYGENVSSQRIVDILNDLKNLNEKLLQTNVDMDSRDATRMSSIPNMIFGNDSPYGRMGEKAGETQNILSRLGQGSSLAQEAWLYSAYGVQDPLEFLERQRKGSLDPENFAAISGKIKSDSGGNLRMGRYIAEGLLGHDKTIPANFVPDVVDYMLSGEEPTKENLDKKVAELQKKYGQNLSGYKSDAEGVVSDTERNRAAQQTITNQIGDDYRTMINKMSMDWLSTSRDLSTSTGNRIILEKELNDILRKSIERLKQFFLESNSGKPGSEEDQYKKGKGRGRFEGPPIPEGEALEDIKKKLGRPDMGLLKDARGRPAGGFVAKEMTKLQKAFSESPLGAQYRISLYEGYDPTGKGHLPNSPHYLNEDNRGAMDISLYDKIKHKKIPKGDYPAEVKEFLRRFTEEEGLTYGGNFKNPDENHLEYNRNKSVADRDKKYQEENVSRKPTGITQKQLPTDTEIDYGKLEHNSGRKNEHSFYEPNTKSRSEGNANFDPNTIRSAIVEGFRELARGNNDRQETRIVVEDRTTGGISAQQSDYARRNANSIFIGGPINPHANSTFK